MLILGQVSDRIGRKRVLLGALGILAIAQTLLITEPDLPGLLDARSIQGFAAGALTGALACLSGVGALGAAWTWTVGLRSLTGLAVPIVSAPIPQSLAE